MDPSFKHQYSLYESMNTGQYGSSSSLNNLASKSSSRLGSPAVKHSTLNQDNQRGPSSSRRDSAISQQSTGLGWGNSNPLGPTVASRTPSGTQFATTGSEPFAATGSFVNPLSNSYSGIGGAFSNSPYASSGPMLSSAAYGGSGAFGATAPQFSGAQFPGPYGTGQYGGQFAAPVSSQHAHGQYTVPYANGAYGGVYGNVGNVSVTGTAESSPAVDPDSKQSERNATDELASTKSDSTNTDFSADAGTSTKATLVTGALASLKGDDDVVLPSDIFWHYIDLQGQQQGPFSGSQMNDWMAYMLDTTMVRRMEDENFVPMTSLKEAANTPEPFAALMSLNEWNDLISRATELKPREEPQAEKAVEVKGAEASAAPIHLSKAADIKQPLLADSEVYTNASSPLLRSRESSLAPGDLTPSLAALKVSEAEKKPVAETPTAETSKPHDYGTHPDSGNRVDSHKAPVAEQNRVPSAVWKKTTAPATQVSISELKKQQEVEKKQQKKKLADGTGSISTSRKSSSSRWLPLDQLDSVASSATSPVASPATSATVTPTWNKQEVVQAKSLSDIKKEQAMKGKTVSNSVASVVAKPIGGARTNAKPVPQLEKGGRFHALQESEAVAHPSSASQTAPKVRQQRNVPAPQPTSITSTANMARPTDELVHWVRVAFKDLVNGVDGMELLDVFLSLPMNNSAKEFIAESVFSYSKTLDGRRFAADFVRRRKAAEEAMAPGETWKDVMRRFNPNVVEQDPSFKVVTKKRAQKISRPGDSMRA